MPSAHKMLAKMVIIVGLWCEGYWGFVNEGYEGFVIDPTLSEE